MPQTSSSLTVKGDTSFINEFEKMLEENKISYSKPQREKTNVKTTYEWQTLYTIISPKEIIEFVIDVTPLILGIIYSWYESRKKNGEILIHTRKGKVKLSAISIRKFEYTEDRTKKSTKNKKTKKGSEIKRKRVRNLKSAQQQKKD